MSEETQTEIDTGMHCLMMQLKLLQIPFSLENLRHRVGKADHLDHFDILFLAEEHLKLKAKEKKVSVNRLTTLPLPVIAELKGGQFCLIIKIEKDTVYFHDPATGKHEDCSLIKFGKKYQGRVVLISDRPSQDKMGDFKNFGIGWFVRAFLSYRFISLQIILSSLIMQVFILMTPLFTMVIIDKVLSNSSRSTLDVLIIALVLTSIFEFLINQSRNHLLHHTSNKVDLHLVSRLFQHLTSLPMVFFSGKQTGDTISRMKEVESIRSFIT